MPSQEAIVSPKKYNKQMRNDRYLIHRAHFQYAHDAAAKEDKEHTLMQEGRKERKGSRKELEKIGRH
jgi:hypothetical protein